MAFMISDKGGKDFKILPQGLCIAVCNLVVDVGLQPGKKYKPKQKIYIRWEVPEERIQWEKDGLEHDGPAVIGNFYTASLSEKSLLRPLLESWRGRAFTAEELDGFDIFSILGKSCQLSVIHNESNGKTYANVNAVMALPKGMKPLVAENALLKYSSDDPDQWDELPEWIRKKVEDAIKEDPDEGEAAERGLVEEVEENEVPF